MSPIVSPKGHTRQGQRQPAWKGSPPPICAVALGTQKTGQGQQKMWDDSRLCVPSPRERPGPSAAVSIQFQENRNRGRVQRAHCAPALPPQHPPGLLGPSNPAGSQHGVLGKGPAEHRALSLPWPEAARGTESDPTVSSWARPLSLTGSPPRVIPCHPPDFSPLAPPGVCPPSAWAPGRPCLLLRGTVQRVCWGFWSWF